MELEIGKSVSRILENMNDKFDIVNSKIDAIGSKVLLAECLGAIMLTAVVSASAAAYSNRISIAKFLLSGAAAQ